jgi:hypothetical protein
MECRHLDGDPSNNRPSNLAWGTCKENGEDRIRHGTSGKGERHGQAKLTEAIVRRIMELDALGVDRPRIAAEVGATTANVQAIASGVSWNHVTGLPKYRPKARRAGAPLPG